MESSNHAEMSFSCGEGGIGHALASEFKAKGTSCVRLMF
jgi:hypothetical protein